jgi:hypothetical protein
MDRRFVLGYARWAGVDHAISPDARFRHPAFRSLDAALAFAILASLGQQRRSIGMGNPSRRSKSAEGL